MDTEARDRLTGLFTDQYLRLGLDQEFQRAKRFKRDLSFILSEPVIPEDTRADMLYTVLKALAKTCEARIRQIDTGVRWGQQVLLVLPETGRDGANRVASKIFEHFQRHKFYHPDSGKKIEVALKQVLMVFPQDGADKETILYNLRESLETAETTAPESEKVVSETPAEESTSAGT